jgi:hypothetical protein
MAEKGNQILLDGRFDFQSPALEFSRARLYADRLELSGWRLIGRYHRRIPLGSVLQVDALNDSALVIWLSVGETIRLRVNRASSWKRQIEAQQVHLKKLAPTSERMESIQ